MLFQLLKVSNRNTETFYINLITILMSILKKPDLADPKLRAKLAKGMGHNYYGEPAWPNDLLYIFPVCILGTIACCIGLGDLEPTP